jgi:protein-S-isoprenylcysteine O-methyltransferase Ste14
MPIIVRTLIFSVLLPGSGTIGIPAAILLSEANPLSFDIGAWRLTGVAPLALGAALYAWCAADFTFVGHGTPAPIDAPTTLVVSGPYRLVRNPMYVAVLSAVLGEMLVFEALTLAIYAGALWAGFHVFIVLYEEPTLTRQFGTSYESYRSTVPRWLPRRGALRPASG